MVKKMNLATDPTISDEITEELKSVEKFIFSQETWDALLKTSIRVLLIVLFSIIVVKVSKVVIKRMFSIKYKGPIRRSERREKTLLLLLENTVSYVVYFAAILAILDEFGIGVKGLLAGAGVLGLAVGFGAQNLVRDVITGFFILFEDQFSVGDYVKIGEAIGTVEEIGLRTTKISAFGGELHILPNGIISEVVNYSVRNSLAVLDIGVSYETDLAHVQRVLEDYLDTLDEERYPELVELPTFVGVQNLAASEIVLRITAETKPMMNFSVARKMRKDIKDLFDRHQIEIPYQKLVVYQQKEEQTSESKNI